MVQGAEQTLKFCHFRNFMPFLCRFYAVFMPLVERKDRYNGAESRADGVKNVGSAEQG